MAGPADVARWMVAEQEAQGDLYQSEVVWGIQEIFGDGFVYENDHGNLAISPAVLREFERLTPHLVWESRSRMWRLREPGEPESRRRAE